MMTLIIYFSKRENSYPEIGSVTTSVLVLDRNGGRRACGSLGVVLLLELLLNDYIADWVSVWMSIVNRSVIHSLPCVDMLQSPYLVPGSSLVEHILLLLMCLCLPHSSVSCIHSLSLSLPSLQMCFCRVISIIALLLLLLSVLRLKCYISLL